jgi:hypothetical protein
MAKKAKKAVVKKVKMRILPRKMSSLIKIALADLRKAEQDREKCAISMTDTWFLRDEATCTVTIENQPRIISEHPICVMCLAGVVIGFSLGAIKNEKINSAGPSDFEKNEGQLESLDCLRTGDVWGAASYLGVDIEKGAVSKFYVSIPEYDADDPEPFHKAMDKLRQKLIKGGY